MFKHFSLERNGIAALANPSSGLFRQLVSNVLVCQPNLQALGDSLSSILESFVSNQNSRLFCALSDLFEWYKAGMNFRILQLTTKHINSIFKRPPYEERPYTQELTYAQRLVMIYHILDIESWIVLTQAYDALYKSQFSKEWANKTKFMPVQGNTSEVAESSFRIIRDCDATIFSPRLQHIDALSVGAVAGPSLSARYSNSSRTTTNNSSSISRGTVKHGKVAKRRSVSTTSRSGKSVSSSISSSVAKPRSISFPNGLDAQTGFQPAFDSRPAVPLLTTPIFDPSWLNQNLPISDISQSQVGKDAINTFPLNLGDFTQQQSIGFSSSTGAEGDFNSQISANHIFNQGLIVDLHRQIPLQPTQDTQQTLAYYEPPLDYQPVFTVGPGHDGTSQTFSFAPPSSSAETISAASANMSAMSASSVDLRPTIAETVSHNGYTVASTCGLQDLPLTTTAVDTMPLPEAGSIDDYLLLSSHPNFVEAVLKRQQN
ncbi:hypothetical protein GGI15_001133 [Coemansia interrupta]|uniref:Uncharacterized protein n=1 Tax=Coemansia interrupta TaxID=1126814 RepID=A0A9W8HLV4_9FUNG|nr:hypothetical protein GGI15_001133 [Coemansia interrupta]